MNWHHRNQSSRPDTVMGYLQLQCSKASTSYTPVTPGDDGFNITEMTDQISPVSPGSRARSSCWDSPRFVWYDETISSHGIEQTEKGTIDLFDITAIETQSVNASSPVFVSAVQACPFCLPSQVIVLQVKERSRQSNDFGFPTSETTTRSIVFQATSESAVKTFVLGMKWMIARLAFNLVVGNLSISCELLRPEQREQAQPKTNPQKKGEEHNVRSSASGDEESMGPRTSISRFPVVRRTKVMNDIAFHLADKALEKQQEVSSSTNFSTSLFAGGDDWRPMDKSKPTLKSAYPVTKNTA